MRNQLIREMVLDDMRILSITKVLALFLVVTPTISLIAKEEPSLEELSQSDIWQVRYVVPGHFDIPTPAARRALERLVTDEKRLVGCSAFYRYIGLFLRLDSDVIEQAFELGVFNSPDGQSTMHVPAEPAYWLSELKSADSEASKGIPIQMLGLLKDSSVISELEPHEDTDNSYVLLELARAYYRLGSKGKYLSMIEKIFSLPVEKTLVYQTGAIELLLQTSPERAATAFRYLHQFIHENAESIQPNWIFSLYTKRVLLSGDDQAFADQSRTSDEMLEALSTLEIWEVRLGVAEGFREPTPTARRVLEKLAVDEHPLVGQSAIFAYTDIFIDPDPSVTKHAFDRGYFRAITPVGRSGRDNSSSLSFWLSYLRSNPDRSLKMLGLLDDPSVLPDLETYENTAGLEIPVELARAYYRLGDKEGYFRVIDKILSFSPETHISQQTEAINYLLQSDPGRASTAYWDLDKRVQMFPEMQPGWMFAHYMQRYRLPEADAQP